MTSLQTNRSVRRRGCCRRLALTTCAVAALSGGLATADQLLEIHNDSLTSYLPTSSTQVQDIFLLAINRSLPIDGSGGTTYSSQGFIPGVIGGDPGGGGGGGCGPGGPIFDVPYGPGDPGGGYGGSRSMGGVRLDTGTLALMNVDLALPGAGFSSYIANTYNSRQHDGTSYVVSDGYQGSNRHAALQPEIVLYDDADNELDMVYVVNSAFEYMEFKRYDDTSTEFKGVNGTIGVMQFAEGAANEPDTYTYTDQRGTEIAFFGFDADASPCEGQFWKKEDAAGNVAYVGHETTGSTAISGGYDGSGRITEFYDTNDRKFAMTYTSGYLTKVEVYVDSGGGYASIGYKTEYSYYVGADTHGEDGDLKLVTTTIPLTDSGVSSVRKKYYRYYEGAYNATTNPGYEHQIKYIIDFEGYRRYDWDQDSSLDDDPLTASEGDLKPYAGAYFEYDTDRRIVEAWFNGGCGCSGAGDGTHTFEYETNGSYSDDAGYDTEWASRTVVKRPDDSYFTQYFDETGQPIARVITDADPDNTSPAPSKWVSSVTRNASGQITEAATPAAVSSYTHSTGAITLNSSAGLIRTYSRISSGDRTGFIDDSKHKKGSSGTAYFDGDPGYTDQTKTIGDVTIVRPFANQSHLYETEQVLQASHTQQYTRSYTFHTGDASLMPKKATVTYPAVSVGENGSGSNTSASAYQRTDGTAAFVESTDGVFTYMQYTDGKLVKQIIDAQTDHATDFAAGDDPYTAYAITESETGQRVITEYSYDDLGRVDEITLPNGDVVKYYYSKLADGRLVTLNYPRYDASPLKFYGPVDCAVHNHAGQIEAQATVALSGNESTSALTAHVDEIESGLIDAMDLGAVARLQTTILDNTGQTATETRQYFNIPGTGVGTEGTNFDATYYAYNDSGKRIRTKDPTGTISRPEFDAKGRTVALYVGTNDNGEEGGEASGTNNMTKTVEFEYDNDADGGNGLRTKMTTDADGDWTGASDQSVTEYEYDSQSRLVLQTNPESPHPFHKYDNLSRPIATGQYSATTSIVVGTDDPTTETTNRLALNQTFYDDLGRVWKTQRHKIDQSDGSDDDSLQALTWYDAAGRRIKADDGELMKYAYDSEGRITHQFKLASDDDTAYADADDVTGDIVLEEVQTIYDDDGHLVLSASIAREHDDYGMGETTGALDTNADNDDLKYTAADLKGRIHFSAVWYDDNGRHADVVGFGTYGGSDFDRDGMSVPARSDTAIRTTHTYYDDGSKKSETDSMGVETRYGYDDAGRKTLVIANYVNGAPSGANGDDDIHTRHEYTDGLPTKMWVDIDGDDVEDADDQVTTYTHGTTKGAGAGDSDIATGNLLQKTVFPDSTGGSDAVTLAFDAQGRVRWRKDQAGNVF